MSKEASREKRLYMIFVTFNAPMQFESSKDLVQDYLDQLQKRKKTNDWAQPFEIIDDDTGEVVAAFSWATMIAIVQGRKLEAGEEIPK